MDMDSREIHNKVDMVHNKEDMVHNKVDMLNNKEDMVHIKVDMVHNKEEVMVITNNKVDKEYLQKNHPNQNYLLCLHNPQ